MRALGPVIDFVSSGRDDTKFLSFQFIVVYNREISVNAKQISPASG